MTFNFIDKINRFESGKLATAEKYLGNSETPYANPETKTIYPMMLVEAIGQLNAWLTLEANAFQIRPVAIMYGQINLYDTASLNENLFITTELTRLDQESSVFNGKVYANEKVLVEVIDAVGSFLAIEAFAHPEDYQQQFVILCTNKNKSPQNQATDTITQPSNLFNYDKTEINDGQIIGEKTIPANYAFFRYHFPKKPVLPISILLQSNINLCLKLIKHLDYDVNKINQIQLTKIKMRDFILPESQLITKVTLITPHPGEIKFSFQTEVNQQVICKGETVISFE